MARAGLRAARPASATAVAWNRNEWIYKTLDVWRKLCDPVAGRMVARHGRPGAAGGARPARPDAVDGRRRSAARCSAASSARRSARSPPRCSPPATSAFRSARPARPRCIPANIQAYGDGLELPEDEVRLYVALREAAHQRLFGHVPWLRGHVLAAVEAYASGITVNREAIEEAMGRVDPADPESMQAMALEGIFTPEDTPAQKAALARLETALALIEGWVCHVVDSAAGDRLPDVVRLAEAFRRRRAAGGPAEQTFAALVGLELRPRRLREAAALWAALTEHRGHRRPRRALGPPGPAAHARRTSPTRRRSPRSQLDLGDLADFDFDSAAAAGTVRDPSASSGPSEQAGESTEPPTLAGAAGATDQGDAGARGRRPRPGWRARLTGTPHLTGAARRTDATR